MTYLLHCTFVCGTVAAVGFVDPSDPHHSRIWYDYRGLRIPHLDPCYLTSSPRTTASLLPTLAGGRVVHSTWCPARTHLCLLPVWYSLPFPAHAPAFHVLNLVLHLPDCCTCLDTFLVGHAICCCHYVAYSFIVLPRSLCPPTVFLHFPYRCVCLRPHFGLVCVFCAASTPAAFDRHTLFYILLHTV